MEQWGTTMGFHAALVVPIQLLRFLQQQQTKEREKKTKDELSGWHGQRTRPIWPHLTSFEPDFRIKNARPVPCFQLLVRFLHPVDKRTTITRQIGKQMKNVSFISGIIRLSLRSSTRLSCIRIRSNWMSIFNSVNTFDQWQISELDVGYMTLVRIHVPASRFNGSHSLRFFIIPISMQVPYFSFLNSRFCWLRLSFAICLVSWLHCSLSFSIADFLVLLL